MEMQGQGQEVPDEDKIPVMILSGLDESGKKSLLKNILMNKEGIKVAALVDDIDYEWFGSTFDEQDVEIEEEFVKFKNGCLVGMVNDDVSQEVSKIAKDK